MAPVWVGTWEFLPKVKKQLQQLTETLWEEWGTESEVYLAGPAVAAASALLGYIGAPEELGL